MILANVSCSDERDFDISFISDLCMKTLIRIIVNPTGQHSKYNQIASETTVLAVLINILNLSSSETEEIIHGMEFLGFLSALENIISNEELPLVTKSVSLLAIANLYTMQNKLKELNSPLIADTTRDFALNMLTEWQKLSDRRENPKELLRNLVYASLVLFYNVLYLA